MTALIPFADSLAFWLIMWSVFGPFVGGLIVYGFMHWRYRAGIATQRQFDRGLFRETK